MFGRRTLARQMSTERQLEEANRRWKMAARAAGIGVFDWDAATDVVTLDARARAIYGLGRDDGQGVTRAEMSRSVHPDDEPLLGANPQEGATLSVGQMRKSRYRIVKTSGVRHVEAVGTALDNGRGPAPCASSASCAMSPRRSRRSSSRSSATLPSRSRARASSFWRASATSCARR